MRIVILQPLVMRHFLSQKSFILKICKDGEHQWDALTKQVFTMNVPRLLKLKTVLEQCAFSRATLYRQIKAGHFPEPVRLTGALDNASSRSVAWREEEILQWIDSRQKVPLSETRRI